jgi:hypothetical protein
MRRIFMKKKMETIKKLNLGLSGAALLLIMGAAGGAKIAADHLGAEYQQNLKDVKKTSLIEGEKTAYALQQEVSQSTGKIATNVIGTSSDFTYNVPSPTGKGQESCTASIEANTLNANCNWDITVNGVTTVAKSVVEAAPSAESILLASVAAQLSGSCKTADEMYTDWPLTEAEAVTETESRGNPNDFNGNTSTGDQSTGCDQVNIEAQTSVALALVNLDTMAVYTLQV